MVYYIFLDFDGTISDVKKQALRCLEETLKEEGYSFEKRRLVELLGEKMRDILKGLGIKGASVERIRGKFYRKLKESIKKGLRPCVSLKPLREISRDHKLVVVSNSDRSFLRESIKKLELRGVFYKVFGADKKKTKEGILKEFFRKEGISGKDTIYVGDRFSDVDFAKKAGCIAVAIHNRCSWSSRRRILQEKPDFIIKDFYGLKKLLKSLD